MCQFYGGKIGKVMTRDELDGMRGLEHSKTNISMKNLTSTERSKCRKIGSVGNVGFSGFSNCLDSEMLLHGTHLNRDEIESNLSVPGIRGCHENALYKSFETSPHLICLYSITNIPLGPA